MPGQRAPSFEALIAEIAQRKAEAAHARRSKRPAGAEAPRDVFRGACARIAEAFAPLGYRYLKSRSHMIRKAEDLSFTVSFGTSHHNAAGVHVKLDLCANVRSKRLEAWRASAGSPYPADRSLAGGMFHRIRGERLPIAWDLADPGVRDAAITDVIATIHADVVPWFARFADLSQLVRELVTTDVPAVDLHDAVELALCFGSKALAQQVIDRIVANGHAWNASIPVFVDLPSTISGYAKQVAWLRCAHGLH